MNVENAPTLDVIAFDPGMTTGWCIIQSSLSTWVESTSMQEKLQNSQIQTGEIKSYDDHFVTNDHHHATEMIELVYRLSARCPGPISVVVEDFVIRTADQKRETMSPVRITSQFDALLRFYMDEGRIDWDIERLIQSPGDAKRTCSNERLKLWGVYDSSSGPHQRDALRHAILAIRKIAHDRNLVVN